MIRTLQTINLGRLCKEKNMQYKNPLLVCKFAIEINGQWIAGFQEISGLKIKTNVEVIREGGVNDFEYKLPQNTTHENITFRYVLANSDDLWKWYHNIIQGKWERRNGSIYLGTPQAWKLKWDFFDAYPVEWEGPALDSGSSKVAISKITLAHHGLVQMFT